MTLYLPTLAPYNFLLGGEDEEIQNEKQGKIVPKNSSIEGKIRYSYHQDVTVK